MASFVYIAHYFRQTELWKSATKCIALNDNYIIIAQLLRDDVNHINYGRNPIGNWLMPIGTLNLQLNA